MTLKIKLLTFLLSTTAFLIGQSPRVFYVELIEGQQISNTPIKEHKEQSAANEGKRITIYPDIEFQTIEGFGGAFNEIGGDALMALPQNLQDEVMNSLFSEEGAVFSFCRTAIGASDFGIDAYSYSEQAGDYQMKYFSVDREKKSVLPYIQKAISVNPELKVFASPWSPPGWMKYSGFMDRGVEFPEKNHLMDEPKIYEAYALYFSRYVQTYAEHGINVSRVVIQNEPDMHTKYPSNVMSPGQMGLFASKYLQPLFKENKVQTQIWAGTFRTAQQLDAIEFAANEDWRNAVDGIGIQYTKPRFIQDMLSVSPKIPMMHTEGKCYNGDNSIIQAKKRLDEVADYLNYGVPNYCYWNMILDETGLSGWDWKQNSLINIDKQNSTVTYNPDFAVMALLGKFMQPGAVRIAGFSRSTLISLKRDGKIYLFLQNDKNKSENFECWIGAEKKHVVNVPANSISVIIL